MKHLLLPKIIAISVPHSTIKNERNLGVLNFFSENTAVLILCLFCGNYVKEKQYLPHFIIKGVAF